MASSFQCLCAALTLVLLSSPAEAEVKRPSSLSWVRMPGAESCIDVRPLAAAVERRLGRAVFVPPSAAELSVEGWIEKSVSPPAWHAVITMADTSGQIVGTRELTNGALSCATIEAELVLVIAVMIDADAGLAPPAAAAPQIPAPPAPPAPRPPTQVVVREVPAIDAARPSPPWRVGLSVGPTLGIGLLPGLGAGVALRGRIKPPRFWAFELGGVAFLPVTVSAPGAGAEVRLSEAFVAACPVSGSGARQAYSACAGIEVGAVHAGGFGFDRSLEIEHPVVNGALSGRISKQIVGILALSAGLGIAIPFVRNQFFWTDAGRVDRELFRMSPVTLSADLSLGLELP